MSIQGSGGNNPEDQKKKGPGILSRAKDAVKSVLSQTTDAKNLQSDFDADATGSKPILSAQSPSKPKDDAKPDPKKDLKADRPKPENNSGDNDEKKDISRKQHNENERKRLRKGEPGYRARYWNDSKENAKDFFKPWNKDDKNGMPPFPSGAADKDPAVLLGEMIAWIMMMLFGAVGNLAKGSISKGMESYRNKDYKNIDTNLDEMSSLLKRKQSTQEQIADIKGKMDKAKAEGYKPEDKKMQFLQGELDLKQQRLDRLNRGIEAHGNHIKSLTINAGANNGLNDAQGEKFDSQSPDHKLKQLDNLEAQQGLIKAELTKDKTDLDGRLKANQESQKTETDKAKLKQLKGEEGVLNNDIKKNTEALQKVDKTLERLQTSREHTLKKMEDLSVQDKKNEDLQQKSKDLDKGKEGPKPATSGVTLEDAKQKSPNAPAPIMQAATPDLAANNTNTASPPAPAANNNAAGPAPATPPVPELGGAQKAPAPATPDLANPTQNSGSPAPATMAQSMASPTNATPQTTGMPTPPTNSGPSTPTPDTASPTSPNNAMNGGTPAPASPTNAMGTGTPAPASPTSAMQQGAPTPPTPSVGAGSPARNGGEKSDKEEAAPKAKEATPKKEDDQGQDNGAAIQQLLQAVGDLIKMPVDQIKQGLDKAKDQKDQKGPKVGADDDKDKGADAKDKEKDKDKNKEKPDENKPDGAIQKVFEELAKVLEQGPNAIKQATSMVKGMSGPKPSGGDKAKDRDDEDDKKDAKKDNKEKDDKKEDKNKGEIEKLFEALSQAMSQVGNVAQQLGSSGPGQQPGASPSPAPSGGPAMQGLVNSGNINVVAGNTANQADSSTKANDEAANNNSPAGPSPMPGEGGAPQITNLFSAVVATGPKVKELAQQQGMSAGAGQNAGPGGPPGGAAPQQPEQAEQSTGAKRGPSSP